MSELTWVIGAVFIIMIIVFMWLYKAIKSFIIMRKVATDKDDDRVDIDNLRKEIEDKVDAHTTSNQSPPDLISYGGKK